MGEYLINMKKLKNIPSVQVLLSTYNGEKYIEKQVKSIINQKNVKVSILIRDDGSTDNTIQKLEVLKCMYPKTIKFYSGENCGYKKSFIDLVHQSSISFDYYAFADQDDYWLSNKLEVAISKIKLRKNKYKLYASTVIISDNNAVPLYKKDISDFVPGFISVMTRVRLAGCTMVFNKELLRLYKEIDFSKKYIKKLPSHDGFLMEMCTAVNGYVFVDDNYYIYHRRLTNSVTGGGNGLRKRIMNEYQRTFKDIFESSSVAEILKNQIPQKISPKNLEFIDKVIEYRSSLMKTFVFATDSSINCGIRVANLETRLKILLRRF